jgi:hypothetical protein
MIYRPKEQSISQQRSSGPSKDQSFWAISVKIVF